MIDALLVIKRRNAAKGSGLLFTSAFSMRCASITPFIHGLLATESNTATWASPFHIRQNFVRLTLSLLTVVNLSFAGHHKGIR